MEPYVAEDRPHPWCANRHDSFHVGTSRCSTPHLDAGDAIGAVTSLTRFASTASRRAPRRLPPYLGAHEVLITLYPSSSTCSIGSAAVVGGHSRRQVEGRRHHAGKDVADRSSRFAPMTAHTRPPPPFLVTDAPGQWSRIAAQLPQRPQFTHWGSQDLRPQECRAVPTRPPPALTSQAYITAYNEVKHRPGERHGRNGRPSARRAFLERQHPGLLAGDHADAPSGTISDRRDRTLCSRSWTFVSDAVIAYFKSKYQLRVWRPVTAIREAATLHNPAIVADTVGSHWSSRRRPPTLISGRRTLPRLGPAPSCS